jgi:hypothetical protein
VSEQGVAENSIRRTAASSGVLLRSRMANASDPTIDHRIAGLSYWVKRTRRVPICLLCAASDEEVSLRLYWIVDKKIVREIAFGFISSTHAYLFCTIRRFQTIDFCFQPGLILIFPHHGLTK